MSSGYTFPFHSANIYQTPTVAPPAWPLREAVRVEGEGEVQGGGRYDYELPDLMVQFGANRTVWR